MDAEIGLDSAGVVTLAAFKRLLVGVDSQVSLKRMFKFENLVAVFTGENLQLGLTYPVGKDSGETIKHLMGNSLNELQTQRLYTEINIRVEHMAKCQDVKCQIFAKYL